MKESIAQHNALGLSPVAAKVAAQVFSGCCARYDIDGGRFFESLLTTGSFKAALNVNDAAVEALYARAYQHFLIGHYGRAEEIFLCLCALEPLRIDFWLGLGVCYRTRGEDVEALRVFERAAEIAPEHPIPHFHLFEVFMRCEDWERAEEACVCFETRRDGTEHDNINSVFLRLKTALEMRLTDVT